MDQSCSDLEFFDFNNATEEEIKEIQAILKGPGSNGCVELPWEIPVKENCVEIVPANEGIDEKADSAISGAEDVLDVVVEQNLQFTSPQTPLSPPVARLPPPPVEAFVAPPTTIGPYANAPYFVSRTIPFVRAYPHMGVPFFACPLPGTGDSGPMPAPYGQFVPMVPATVGQEKYIGQTTENDTLQKNRGPSDRQFNRRNKKKLSNSEYSFDSENAAEIGRETVTAEEQVTTIISCPVSTAVTSDRPTSVPLVPLPVPPSTFGGTLPLHGYPPGLHTLPYTQMSGPPQAPPSAAMYYVPVFNHPYGSYIPSPPSAPMVLPVNLRPENECITEVDDCSGEEVLNKNISSLVLSNTTTATTAPTSVTKPTENDIQLNCEVSSPEQCEDIAKNDAAIPTEAVEVTDCDLASGGCNQLDMDNHSLSGCISEKVTLTEDRCQFQSTTEVDSGKDAVGRSDASRCWADLFKKPCSEVNGIDHENLNNLGKEVSNGKLYSVPASDTVL